jgi:hypothetical protein
MHVIIDEHNHLGSFVDPFWSPGQTPEQLHQDTDQARMDKAVAVPLAFMDTDRIADLNNYIYESVKKFQDRIIGFFIASPCS